MPRFFTLGVIAAVIIAWVGAMIHRSGHAPLGLVSIGLGAALGASIAWIAAKLCVTGQRSLIPAALVLALVTIIAQHAWLYADFRREWHEGREASPQIAMFRDESPWSPWEYMMHEATPRRTALWCLDAALITAAACGTFWIMRGGTHVNSASRPTPRRPDS
jgi:hypothetical protein